MSAKPVLNDKEKSIILQVVGSYPAVTKQSPSSWACFTNDLEKSTVHLADICHASMQRHKPGFDQCITGVPRDQALDLAYINFLIDGPFKSFKDRITLESIEVAGIPKYYLRCSSLDTWPANVLYNFCIATRVPIEYPDFIKYWGIAKGAGVNEALAFLVVSRLACHQAYYGQTRDIEGNDPWAWKLSGINCPAGHFWFDNVSGWGTILSGEPLIKSFSQSFKEHPTACRPCNVIWGQETRTAVKEIGGKTVEEISDYFKLNKINDININQMVEAFEVIEPDEPVDEDLDFDLFVDDDDDDDDFDDNEVFEDDFGDF